VLRLLLVLVVIAAAVWILRTVGVLLVIGSLGLIALAYWRPEHAARVSGSRAVQRLPLWTRATPMRFGIVLTAALVPATAVASGIAPPSTSPSPVVQPAFAAADSASRQATPVAQGQLDSPPPAATPRPTLRPSPQPTPKPRPVFGAEPTGRIARARVTRVIDGDTIEVAMDGQLYRVRYIGIDTPETHNGLEWLGPEAARANARLVEGRSVVLEKDVSETDRYGRLLRYVWLKNGADWLLVNAELLRTGYAQITTYPPDVKYVDELYRAAQHKAREHDRGLWGPTPTPEPVATPVTLVGGGSQCHPSYRGACLKIGVDYDCVGGSGDGPYYIGLVEVVGYDEYRLDYDHDGLGCEDS